MLTHRRRQRGLSIIELMVGVAIGLFVVAGATLMVSGQLSSNRRLLLDTQLQQDLRATAEIVARELRRGGAQTDVLAAALTWRPESASPPAINGYALNFTPSSGQASSTNYYYSRSFDNTNFRIFLEPTRGRIQTVIQGVAQDLTDPDVLKVTTFNLTTVDQATVRLICPNACPGGDFSCWPTVSVRDVQIDLRGEAVNDPSIKRSIRTTVRIRNDVVRRDASITSGMCPA